jgi:hypothetical protein
MPHAGIFISSKYINTYFTSHMVFRAIGQVLRTGLECSLYPDVPGKRQRLANVLNQLGLELNWG